MGLPPPHLPWGEDPFEMRLCCSSMRTVPQPPAHVPNHHPAPSSSMLSPGFHPFHWWDKAASWDPSPDPTPKSRRVCPTSARSSGAQGKWPLGVSRPPRWIVLTLPCPRTGTQHFFLKIGMERNTLDSKWRRGVLQRASCDPEDSTSRKLGEQNKRQGPWPQGWPR